MRALCSYTRFELLRLLALPANRVLICGAAMVTLLATFMIGQWFPLNQAGLEAFLPYAIGGIGLLAPALAMWLWAAERQRGTIEMLAAWPLGSGQVLLGKFFAGWLVMALFIVLTMPLGITALLLGKADVTVMLAQYGAVWLLSGLFLAVAFLATVRAASLLVGFFAGILLVVALWAASWLIGAGYLPHFLPGALRTMLLEGQPLAIFSRMGQGMLLLADLCRLAVLIGTALIFTYWRRYGDMGPQPRKRYLIGFAVLLAIVGCAGTRIGYGFDMTAEKLHTPDAGVKRLLGDIAPIPVTYTLYLSADHPGLGNRQRLFVNQLQFYLSGLARHLPNVQFDVRNPTASLEGEMDARRLYLEPTEDARGRRYYFALSIDVGGRRDKIYPSEARYAQLPRDLMEKTTGLLNAKARRVLMLSDLLIRHQSVQPRFVTLLSDLYQVDVPERSRVGYISDKNAAVIVFRGTQLPEETVYALDQYARRGGQIMVLEDPYLETAPVRQYATPGPDDGLLPYPSLHRLLDVWGLSFIPREVVYDPASAANVRVSEGAESVRYPLWLELTAPRFGKSPITGGLQSILMPEAGHFVVQQRPNMRYQPLLQTSEKSRWIERKDLVALDPLLALKFVKGEEAVRYPAVIAEGKVSGLFKERPQKVLEWFAQYGDTNVPADEDATHLTESKGEARIIAIADIDFLHEQVAYETVEDKEIWIPSNDNVFFFVNAVRWLVGDAVVSDVRTNLGTARPFVALMPWVDAWHAIEGRLLRTFSTEMQQVDAAIKTRMMQALVDRQGSQALHEDLQQLERRKVELMRAIDEASVYTTSRLEWVARATIMANLVAVPVVFALLLLLFRRRKA